MPAEWGPQGGSLAGRAEWGTQTNEAANPTITGYTGTIAPGETVTFTTVLLGTITTFTFGGVSIPIDSTAADEVTVIFPDALSLDLDWGAEYASVAGDGTDTATRNYTLEAEASWEFFELASVPDFVETDSFAELGENTPLFVGYTAAAGQQFQYTTHAALTTDDDDQSIVFVNPEQTAVGTFRIRYMDDDGVTPRYIESPFNIGEQDLTPDAFTFADLIDRIASTVYTSETITPAGYNETLPISVTGGEYSINGGAFTAIAGTISPTDTVQLRATSSASYPGTQTVTLDIGGVTDDWVVTNLNSPPDDVPDAFSFSPVVGATQSQLYTSGAITVSGINIPAAISVSGGEYSIDGGAWETDPGTVEAGEQVQLRLTTSAAENTESVATLTIGGVSGGYSVTTINTAPDAFTLTDQSDVEPSTVYESNTITVAGITAPASISIDGAGQYSINGGAWVSSAGSVTNGQTVRVRNTSNGSFEGVVSTTLTIGGVTDSFTLTTRATDTDPDQFSFNDVTGAPLSTVYTSNTVTLAGFIDDAPISVSAGAEYSINGGVFTVASSTVSVGDTVSVRILSSSANGTPVNATLTVGAISDSFTVTTESAFDTVPNPFAFAPVTDAAASTSYISSRVKVSGLNQVSPITIAGGEYSINGGVWQSAPSTIVNGQEVRVRQTSSAVELTTTTVELNIGGVTADYDVTTADFFDAGDITAISGELSIFPNHENSPLAFVYDGNATEIRLSSVVSDDGEPLANLTVAAQITTIAGVNIGAAITMTHNPTSLGSYEGDFMPSGLTHQNNYLLVVGVSSGVTQIAEFTLPFTFKRRGNV